MRRAKWRKSRTHTIPASLPPYFPFRGNGFSLIELLIVLLLFSVLTGMAMTLIVQGHRSLQSRLSSSTLFANGVMALNQMTREIRMAGFPSAKSFTAAAVTTNPGVVATSFVAASGYDLTFEADTDGSGLKQIEYVLPAGMQTITRRSTLKNLDGTLATSTAVSTAFLDSVDNQVQGQPLFSWDSDPLSSSPFPQNIRTVYISIILKSKSNESGMPVSMTLTATCQRMNR
jgi:prepilin-type N-terminal cleavage/methylation domain-containing protein